MSRVANVEEKHFRLFVCAARITHNMTRQDVQAIFLVEDRLLRAAQLSEGFPARSITNISI